MSIIIHKDSHVDHGVNKEQLDWAVAQMNDDPLVKKLADSAKVEELSGVLIRTYELPESLGTVPCGLFGPIMGDQPVKESSVTHVKRGKREWTSRLIFLPKRQVKQVTVIVGPHDGNPLVLFTAYGGPLAPQEPNDPGCRDKAASEKFWSEHALAEIED